MISRKDLLTMRIMKSPSIYEKNSVKNYIHFFSEDSMKTQAKNFRFARLRLFLFLIFVCFTASILPAQEKITAPGKFFGFKLGADKKMARWDKIVDYFYLLAKQSDEIKVTDMGPSTMGNPFLVVVISSAENLSNMSRLKEINAKISDPGSISETEIASLIKKGKAVICQSMGLHATEIASSQMAPQLAYELISQNDAATRTILDNVLFFMIPCFNPDGQIMVTDWYRKTLGTKYEGTGLPWLYHKYVGHDNNRDGDFLSMIESKYAAKLMYVDWPPQAYIDHHQMGSYGARFYVPPYCDPIRPYADPLIWREISWYGAHIAYKLEEDGIQGVLNDAQFPGWGHFGWHWITPFHNIAGMLTEAASAQLASPIYIHPEQLKAGARQFPEYKPQSTFPDPWPGGWWRLSDIVEEQKVAARALLDLAAKNREMVLRNAYLKAKRQTERGEQGDIKSVVIPATQHDPLTAKLMINILLKSGIEIRKAQNDFTADGKIYKKDSYLISFAQPKMGLIRNLLVRTHYVDDYWTRDRNGSPLRPYDLSTHTMHEFMGVRVDPLAVKTSGNFTVLKSEEPIAGTYFAGGKANRLDGRLNASFKAVNLLLDKGIEVKRATECGGNFRPGDFVVTNGASSILTEIAKQTGVDFIAVNEIPEKGIRKVARRRVGMFQRYYGGNMDEGWTRFLLEQFSFPYKTVRSAEIKKGNLNKKYDLMILPNDPPGMITGNLPERYRRYISSDYPPEYKSGIGKVGVKNLQHFVENGGTLVTLGEACEFAIKEFALDVKNVMTGYTSTEFFCPGSTIRVKFDNHDPLAYGMPAEGCVVYTSSPAFEIVPGRHNERYKTVVRYLEKDLLQSGWLIGEKKLAKKAAMVRAEYGKGSIILIGFRTQHRYQTHGTFKLLFNTIIQ